MALWKILCLNPSLRQIFSRVSDEASLDYAPLGRAVIPLRTDMALHAIHAALDFSLNLLTT